MLHDKQLICPEKMYFTFFFNNKSGKYFLLRPNIHIKQTILRFNIAAAGMHLNIHIIDQYGIHLGI